MSAATGFSLAPRGCLQVIFPAMGKKGEAQSALENHHWQVYPWSPRRVYAKPVLKPAKSPDRIRLSRRRLLALIGTPLLHLDIRTPFGEDVSEEQVESALQAALGPHRDKRELRGWHVLRVEDTHVGSVHRLLATFSANPEAQAIDLAAHQADYALPLELGIYGLGNLIGPKLGMGTKPWQLLMRHADHLFSALFIGGYGVHIKSMAATHPEAMSRLLSHAAMLNLSESAEAETQSPSVVVLGPGLNLPATPSSKPYSLTSMGMAECLIKHDLLKASDPASLSSQECLALGMAVAAAREEIRSHDQNPEEVAPALRGQRMRANLVVSLGLSLTAFAVGSLGLGLVRKHHQGIQKVLLESAADHGKQVVQLESFRKRLASVEDSLTFLGNLAQEPYPVSLLLSRLGEVSTQGGVQAMQIRRLDDGGLEMRLRAFTSDWEKVEGIRSTVGRIPGATHAEIAEQRKEGGQGKVFFDLSAKVEAP